MGHLTEEGLRTYLETFHRELESKASRYLPAHMRGRLTHTIMLPARIVRYVSTQFGIAVDYDPPNPRTGSESTRIEVVRGSRRIEELVLTGAPQEMLQSPPVVVIQSPNRVQFSGMSLKGPFRFQGEDIQVIFDRCLFSWGDPNHGGWWLGTAWLEVFGNRHADYWSPAMATARATEEALGALYELHRASELGVSLSEYYAKHRDKTVLLLGSYSDEGEKRLRFLAKALSELGYEPILIKDVPDLFAQTLEQKTVMVGSLCRFVIVDDTEGSGHLVEIPRCKANGWITVVLRPDGKASTAKVAGISVLSNVISERAYDPSDPSASLPDACRWAENTRTALIRRLQPSYPRRGIPGTQY